MSKLNPIQIFKNLNRRILILVVDGLNPITTKTANGAILYLNDEICAVIDDKNDGKVVQEILGYGGQIPIIKNIQDGIKYSPTHLLLGNSLFEGKLPVEWRQYIREAIELKLNILNGLHTLLSDDDEFKSLAKRNDVKITDFRKITPDYQTVAKGSWIERKAKVILTIGTDCNIGKMTTTIELYRELLYRDLKADFIATGQTGILIRGRGVAVDAIASDYIAGAVEKQIDVSEKEGFDYIIVEGQGALTHIGYSGVTLGLLHGAMPDAMILCHQPARLKSGYGYQLLDLRNNIILYELMINMFKKTKVVGIGINPIPFSNEKANEISRKIEMELGLPAIDSLKNGASILVDSILNYFKTDG